MYSEEDIASAIKADILTNETATAFRAHVEQRKSSSAVDEEHFRLITGFNDIFVVIACLLLLASVAWIGATITPWLGAATVSAVAWLLAEFFIRKRRMALPAIVLLLAFVGGVLAASIIFLDKSGNSFIVASALASAAAGLHWWRFQVPITVAAGTAAVVGCIIAFLFITFPETRSWASSLSFIAGITIFALAIKWDATDTLRQTRRSDVAFWLHLLAAPLLVHPVFASLGVFSGQPMPVQAVSVLALYVAIALISLSIDRRALMVSALAYVLYTFSALLEQFGVVSLSFAITALVIGSALLVLSAFWHPSRAFVLRLFPVAIQNRLAPFR